MRQRTFQKKHANNCASLITYKRISLITPFLLFGCATVEPPPSDISDSEDTVLIEEQKRVIENQQKKIAELEQLLAMKAVEIKQGNIREKEQEQVIEAASHEITRAQIKLHRLATRSSSASIIAEAEIAMDALKQQSIHQSSEEHLQKDAQRLLDAATFYFSQDDYALATDFASQSVEFTNMVADTNRDRPNRVTVAFNSPVRLQVSNNVNLRQMPGTHSTVLAVLEKGTFLTATAYQGNWLRIQTDQNRQGWVSNMLVEVSIVK